jgi:hypothetical protein
MKCCGLNRQKARQRHATRRCRQVIALEEKQLKQVEVAPK